ncbi:ComF family protein [Paenibacillus athensensis]|uniref:ComF family protein n=1 Tax=Paenibacillus athensensis TaxID=1967502 RepID=UPI001430F98E|nr:ComF family protein [Paenibacillus athensensis]MCD1260852.1 ComF family protein [Paenibacillus athensensis]
MSYDENMKALLARYKYRGDERLAGVIGQMLCHAYRLHQTGKGSKGEHQKTIKLISFVPVSELRLAERGFNQAEQMAVVLGNREGLPVVPLLRRVKHTDKQSFKGRHARIGDLRDVFELNEQAAVRLMSDCSDPGVLTIYLVDDVYTTGSTMNQCAGVLQTRLNAVVYGLTWAR